MRKASIEFEAPTGISVTESFSQMLHRCGPVQLKLQIKARLHFISKRKISVGIHYYVNESLIPHRTQKSYIFKI